MLCTPHGDHKMSRYEIPGITLSALIWVDLIRTRGKNLSRWVRIAESRYLAFTATNRDIWHLPRQIAIISFIRDKSRFLWFSASDRAFINHLLLTVKFQGFLRSEAILTNRYKK